VSYRIINTTKSTTLSKKVEVADSFFTRLKGLMFRERMPWDEALIFYNSPSIHTFFMKFPIDIVFLDGDMRVIRIARNFEPWGVISCFKSYLTIELPPSKTAEEGLEVGDILEILTA
jgi:hypothetical protein|tara:strand:- start:594 stop:944 length:351 start_codon:yes stop_codon:yes gene_type:complete